ncbi:hypothetical protein CRH09_26685 [Nocardia terpenica]|uniref:Type 2A encapsulin shell protein SrpI-like domain-containing protein n=2 Tax=Nocardia terpenica TaxID=455432 RepID=A0A291RPK5_9NOCA|nr:hypothetical protein CRH09_26685 [Nocardia terpenica]
MRTVEQNEVVLGLHQTELLDEYELGLNVHYMGTNQCAIIEYLVSVYYSAAILVPDPSASSKTSTPPHSEDKL